MKYVYESNEFAYMRTIYQPNQFVLDKFKQFRLVYITNLLLIRCLKALVMSHVSFIYLPIK